VTKTWADLNAPDAPFEVAALAAALDDQRAARGLSWAALAGALRVSASTLKGLATRLWGVEGDGVLQMLIWLERTPESFVPGHPGAYLAEGKLPVVAPPGLLRFDVPGIHRRIDAERERQGLTWAEAAAAIGGPINAQTLKAMAGQTRTGFPQVMRYARWLKVPCAALTRAAPW